MNNILAVSISGLSGWLDSSQYNSADALISGKVAVAINFFVIFSAVIAVIMLVIAGYTFITSAGDAERVEKAGKTLTAAIVGMAIVFIARILVEYILKVIGQ